MQKIFDTTQPDDQALSQIYDSDYFLGEKTEKGKAIFSQLKQATAQYYFGQLRNHVDLAEPTSLLEIGCGEGDFLLEAQKNGCEVAGLEISKHAAGIANRKLGREVVIAGELKPGLFADRKFGVVAFSDVLEHTRDPVAFLKNVRSLLLTDGAVFIVVPSLDSWSAKLMGRHWVEYKTEHLYYFGRKSISLALAKSGLQPLAILPNFKILSFDYITRHFQRFPVPVLSSVVSALRTITPGQLANRPFKIVASGMVIIAKAVLA